jgi:hydroxymethylglutaryl-CoA synthase
MSTDVGIDQIGIYIPRHTLPLDRLAAARGVPPEKISVGLGALAMAVPAPWEDTVTLGANAAARALRAGGIAPDEIGLLVVGTETAVDHAKPASIFLHELLGLSSRCRTFELKHACYGGTAGVMMAVDWVRSGAARGRKALIVATDIARYDLGSSAEFTQGAGAAALVIGAAPRLLALDPLTGVYAHNVWDFWRPLDRREALVDGKFSVDCYLDALAGALADYRGGAEPVLDRMAALLYHTPFPKMAQKAHRRLVEREQPGLDAAAVATLTDRTYAELVEPWLWLARQAGNTYTASLYLCLAWLAEQQGPNLEGRDIGLFSYGSGCQAEFFSGRFAPGSAAHAARIGAAALLADRVVLTVEQYEQFVREGARGGTPAAGDAGLCHLTGVRDHKRHYEAVA